MYKERKELYKKLEEKLNSKLLVYINSDKQGFETDINRGVIDFFINQLDIIGSVEKLSLYLHTGGGDIAVAWTIVNLLKQYCNKLEVIIPHKAHSAGTLISIGANSIIMSKQATLSPIDPSINTPLNPPIPNTQPQATYQVSVEAVKGYLAFAKEELGIKDDIALSNIMSKLSDNVHPLVLGQVYRSKAQIKMLAEKLLVNQIKDKAKIDNAVNFLCSDSGSHDYTINRREASEDLGLSIIKPDEEMYSFIKNIYNDISEDLDLTKPFTHETIVRNFGGIYSVKRLLLESVAGGSDYIVSDMSVKPITINIQGQPQPQQGYQTQTTFTGWKHDD